MTFSERWDAAHAKAHAALTTARGEYLRTFGTGDSADYCVGALVVHLQYALMDLEEARERIKDLEAQVQP